MDERRSGFASGIVRQIGIGDVQQLLRDQVGRELLLTMANATAVLEWGDLARDEVPSNGSMSFVDTGKALIGITARHVYEAYYRRTEENPNVRCQIDNMPFAPKERLISLGNDCDLATFALRPSELTQMNKATISWPPAIPERDQIVLFAGLPGLTKASPSPGYVDLGFYTGFGKIDSVNERDISFLIPPNEMLLDVLGKGLPPPGYDLGGMSGGPVALLLEQGGIIFWSLSGIIYECGSAFQIVKAARADLICYDGRIM